MIAACLEQLLDRYPEFQEEPSGIARILGQMAFAYAAAGQPRRARALAQRCLKASPTELRGYLAIITSFRLVPARFILWLAHSVGKGI